MKKILSFNRVCEYVETVFGSSVNAKSRTFNAVRLTCANAIDCPTVVMVKSPGSKEPWYLATSLVSDARTVIALYARRFTCEEQFRDAKDPRFGLGLEQSVVGCCERRDRLMLLNALATVLFTLIVSAPVISVPKTPEKHFPFEERVLIRIRQG